MPEEGELEEGEVIEEGEIVLSPKKADPPAKPKAASAKKPAAAGKKDDFTSLLKDHVQQHKRYRDDYDEPENDDQYKRTKGNNQEPYDQRKERRGGWGGREWQGGPEYDEGALYNQGRAEHTQWGYPKSWQHPPREGEERDMDSRAFRRNTQFNRPNNHEWNKENDVYDANDRGGDDFNDLPRRGGDMQYGRRRGDPPRPPPHTTNGRPPMNDAWSAGEKRNYNHNNDAHFHPSMKKAWHPEREDRDVRERDSLRDSRDRDSRDSRERERDTRDNRDAMRENHGSRERDYLRDSRDGGREIRGEREREGREREREGRGGRELRERERERENSRERARERDNREKEGREMRYNSKYDENGAQSNSTTRYNNHSPDYHSYTHEKSPPSTSTSRSTPPSPRATTSQSNHNHNGMNIVEEMEVEPVLSAAETRLQLIIDIDHTLVHSTTDPRAQTISDVDKIFTLPGSSTTYYVKLRPNVSAFLAHLHPMFDFLIYSMGTRAYVEQIASILDPEKQMFQRIISREDHGEATTKEKKSLAIFDDENMSHRVLILDDRDDVWRRSSGSENLIKIEPFLFFEGLLDSNAPPQVAFSLHDMCKTFPFPAQEESARPYLDTIANLLSTIHAEYVGRLKIEKKKVIMGGETTEPVDVKAILQERRTRVLAGCNLVFSGIFPLQIEPGKHSHTKIWKTTISFGAHVGHEVEPNTTHLIATKPGTQKSARAAALGARVVHLGWLRDCVKYYTKLNEEPYLLMPHTPTPPPPLLHDLPEAPPSPTPPPPPPPPPEEDEEYNIYLPTDPLSPPPSPPSPSSSSSSSASAVPPHPYATQAYATAQYPEYPEYAEYAAQYPHAAYAYQYPPPAGAAQVAQGAQNPFAALPASVLWSMMSTITAARNYWANNPQQPQSGTASAPYGQAYPPHAAQYEYPPKKGREKDPSKKGKYPKSTTQGIAIADLAATAAILAARLNAANPPPSSSSSSSSTSPSSSSPSSSSSTSTSTTTSTSTNGDSNYTNNNNNINYNNNNNNNDSNNNKNRYSQPPKAHPFLPLPLPPPP